MPSRSAIEGSSGIGARSTLPSLCPLSRASKSSRPIRRDSRLRCYASEGSRGGRTRLGARLGLRALGTFGLGRLRHVIKASSRDNATQVWTSQRREGPESRERSRGVRQKMHLPSRVERRRDARLGRSFSNSSFGSHCSRRHRPPTPFSSSSPLTASSPTRAPRAHPLKKRGAVGYPPTDIFDRRSRRNVSRSVTRR